jgi:hypothetical protein
MRTIPGPTKVANIKLISPNPFTLYTNKESNAIEALSWLKTWSTGEGDLLWLHS